ncbi:MAG TPA: class I SAM-dependent methyltransferase [Pirellulales bacterium]|nr:class I SAM-dependent methyltransferase [Pirellulales bacterium]
MTHRNHEVEHRDSGQRKYSYDFDDVLRSFMFRAFEPMLPDGRALELGCYLGAFTTLLVPKYRDLTVIEAAADLIEKVRQVVPPHVRLLQSTFEAIELQETFDAVFFVHTLEHVDDAILVLRRVREWLSPGGRLFLAVPNANAPSRQIAVKMGLIEHNTAVTPGEREHGHRRTYAFDTLERDVVAAGLRAIHRGGVVFKALANFQFDQAIASGVISREYLEGCFQLGMQYPDLCATIYLVCERGP